MRFYKGTKIFNIDETYKRLFVGRSSSAKKLMSRSGTETPNKLPEPPIRTVSRLEEMFAMNLYDNIINEMATEDLNDWTNQVLTQAWNKKETDLDRFLDILKNGRVLYEVSKRNSIGFQTVVEVRPIVGNFIICYFDRDGVLVNMSLNGPPPPPEPVNIPPGVHPWMLHVVVKPKRTRYS